MSKIIRTRKPSVLPYYAAALAFVVLCAVLPVYRLWALLAALGAWLGMELVIYTMILASVLFVLYALARRMRVGAFGPAITIAAIMIAFYFF